MELNGPAKNYHEALNVILKFVQEIIVPKHKEIIYNFGILYINSKICGTEIFMIKTFIFVYL